MLEGGCLKFFFKRLTYTIKEDLLLNVVKLIGYSKDFNEIGNHQEVISAYLNNLT